MADTRSREGLMLELEQLRSILDAGAGIVASSLRRAHGSESHFRGATMEGRTILGIAGAAVAAAIGISTAAARNSAGEVTSAGAVSAFEVRIGDCFDDEAFENTEISEVPAVPCSQPPDNEGYATFDLTGEWPGVERVQELAHDGCLDRFVGAIGKSYEDSEIDFTTMYPTEGSWTERSDREVICVGYHMEYKELTTSVIGSGR